MFRMVFSDQLSDFQLVVLHSIFYSYTIWFLVASVIIYTSNRKQMIETKDWISIICDHSIGDNYYFDGNIFF